MTKEELREIPNIEKIIEDKKEQLVNLKAMAMGIPSIKPKIKVQESTSNKSMAIVAEAVDLEREIEKDIIKLIKMRKKAYYMLDKLSGTERRLMELRYVNGYKWRVIAEKLSYSLQHVHRIHKRILARLK